MSEKEASYYSKLPDGGCLCGLCPSNCLIGDGKAGRCKVRANKGGVLYAISYGEISAAALDPIEKKPLRMFMPGSRVLSIGSYGCNLSCPFCQNHDISMSVPSTRFVAPEDMARMAQAYAPQGNIGLAYTYNEPLSAYEHVVDCAAAVRALGLKNVLVSNGSFSPEPFAEAIKLMDAANIDLKGSEKFYQMVGGSCADVRRNIRQAAAVCHVEVTWLAIPGENDSDEEMEEASGFLAGIDPGIPLHITRFFPKYKYAGRQATPKETVLRLVDVARSRLRNVFAGNMA
jgi:pyruvate formate lyase activating enzyme